MYSKNNVNTYLFSICKIMIIVKYYQYYLYAFDNRFLPRPVTPFLSSLITFS